MEERVDSLLRVDRVIEPTADTRARTYVADYEAAYRRSIADPEAFWDGVARELETGTFPKVDPETGEFVALEGAPDGERDA